jgi:hypothetical protein
MCTIDLVLLSVCLSVRQLDFFRHFCTWRAEILDPWPKSPGIWPWLGPLLRRIRFFKYNLGSFAYSLIRPKSQIPNIRHDGTLSIGNMLMIKKTQESWIWTRAFKKCAPCFRGNTEFPIYCYFQFFETIPGFQLKLFYLWA